MKVKFKYQSDYEDVIKADDPKKLIRLVEQHQRTAAPDDCIQIILALSSILEDDEMGEYVRSGLFIPVIGRLINDTASLFVKNTEN